MIAVARFVGEHRRTVARTLRETFGVGLSDLGDGLTWGEAFLLLQEAAGDPSTHLGAELAEWYYPASFHELVAIAANSKDEATFESLAPWTLGPRTPATPEEIEAAQAELEAEIVFAE